MQGIPAVWHAGETELRTLGPDDLDFARAVGVISTDAYPVLNVPAGERDAFVAKMRDAMRADPMRTYIGAYRGGELVGCMQHWDFTMRVRGVQCRTGGLGSVAVDFVHKRRGVARDLVRGFLDRTQRSGAGLAALYPFQPAFYRALGFGYGTKIDRYRVRTDALPTHGARERVRRIEPADAALALDAYHVMQSMTDGLMRRSLARMQRSLEESGNRAYGVAGPAGTLCGYVIFAVVLGPSGTQNTNELNVTELVYDAPETLAALLAFLRAQGDQFSHVTIVTQDADFHLALADPRNGSNRSLAAPAWHETNAQGVGIMYRVVDLPVLVRALADVRFGALSARLQLHLDDPLIETNSEPVVLAFDRGALALDTPRQGDAALHLDVADFSSLMMGATRLPSLVRYGRARLTQPAQLAELDAAFTTDPPQCKTAF